MQPSLFETVRGRARVAKSWRAVFPLIPQVHSSGIYVLRGGYFRQPYRDAWHNPPPFLHCVYHRVFSFRPDGSLLYANIPGTIVETVRRIQRVATQTTKLRALTPSAVAAADDLGAGTTAVTGAAASASSRPRRRGRQGRGRAEAEAAAEATVKAAQSEAAIHIGRYCLEGSILRAEVWAEKGRIQRWTLALRGSADPSESADVYLRGGGAAEASSASDAFAGRGAGLGAAFGGMSDLLQVQRAAMSFTDGASADDSMRAALAASAEAVSSSSEDERSEDAAPRAAFRGAGTVAGAERVPRVTGFTWPADDPTRVEIESLAGTVFRFLPVQGL